MYIDDVHPHGDEVEPVWEDTVKVVGALVDAGFLLNLSKCIFLAADLVVLGFRLFKHEYQLGKKALGKLLTTHIPKTQKELQGVLGKLNFASKFLPNYQRLVRPLKALLSKHSDHKWTQEHTAALNQLLQLASQKLKLTVADPS